MHTTYADGRVCKSKMQQCRMRTSLQQQFNGNAYAVNRAASRKCLRPRLRLVLQASSGSSTSAAAAAAAAAAAERGARVPYSKILPRQAVAMFASGAVLGPFCDGLHSQHDVLHYVHPSIKLQIEAGSLHWSFETCWWVPLLFGIAGLILGVSVPLLDRLMLPQGAAAESSALPNPSWGAVLLCISLFVTQYGLSGVLEQPALGQTLGNTPIPTIDAILLSYALAHFWAFDRTPQGFGMAALTAVCGPAVEMLLINVSGLYHYTHPVVLGVPTWIPWVYFCGGPAVGNLGRRVAQQIAARELAK